MHGMETSAPLILNNALLHSNTRIKQMSPQIIHILPCILVDSLSQIL